MSKNWNQTDLANLKAKKLKITGQAVTNPAKIEKISVEKNTIQAVLENFKKQGLIKDFVTEHRFAKPRMFRFDWAILSIGLAVEYEGLFSAKSGHTTVTGYSSNCSKYNLATSKGWRVLRYTALNYKEFENDLKKILK